MFVFLFVGVFGGIVVGFLVCCWGDCWLLIVGLVIFGGVSLFGVLMQDFVWLFVICFVEGFGFFIVVVVVFVVLYRIISEMWCSVVFGLWSIFMVGGIVFLMLFGLLFVDWCVDW